MRPRPAVQAALALLLAAPAALAFFSGGYTNVDLTTAPRAASWYATLVAGFVACLLVAGAPRVLPSSRGGRLAVAGLVGLAAWVGISIGWAPLSTPATQDFQRLILYAAAFVAACAWLRGRDSLRLTELALGGGTVLVIVYALSARYLPGVVHQDPGALAADRLKQPLTYYNALGCVAAIGFVLCARIAGDGTRPRRLQAAAVAACVPLGLAAYLTLSRGALAALLAGLVALTFLAPSWAQLRATAIAAAGALVAAAVGSRLGGFASLQGSASTREVQGLLMLALTLALMSGAVLALLTLARRRPDPGPLPLPRRAPLIGFAVILGIVGLLLGAAYKDRKQVTRTPAAGTAPARLASIDSNRYAYWQVAVREFGRHPLNGLGSGGFRAAWLRERKITEPAQDAHSLYIETAAELGVVGLALLALLYGGVAARARRVYAADPLPAAGPIAALTVFALHAGVDWDWEMPAVSLIALLLGAALVAASERERDLHQYQSAESATAESTTIGTSAAMRKRVSP